MIRLVIFSGLFLGCMSTPPPDGPLPEETLARLRSQVREIIRPECGSCHTSSLPTAKPAAVRVFDLVRVDWSADMTEKQLDGFRSRAKDVADSVAAKVDSLLIDEGAKYARPPAN